MMYDYYESKLKQNTIYVTQDNKLTLDIIPLYFFDGKLVSNNKDTNEKYMNKIFSKIFDIIIYNNVKETIIEKLSNEKNKLKKFDDSKLLTKIDIEEYLGIKDKDENKYTTKTLEIINNLKEIQIVILDYFQNLVEISNNSKKMLINLTKIFKANITKEEILDLNKFKEIFLNSKDKILVSLIKIDKYDINKETIISTKNNIYETYYNYILMDKNINSVDVLEYNQQSNNFIFKPTILETTNNEEKYKVEIKELKKEIPKDALCQFLR